MSPILFLAMGIFFTTERKRGKLKTVYLQQNKLNALISQIYFWNKSLHVSDSSSVHHQEFFTVQTAMVYVIQVLLTACEQDQEGTSPALILLASCMT